MARYTGPATKKARAFGEAIYGPDKSFIYKKKKNRKRVLKKLNNQKTKR